MLHAASKGLLHQAFYSTETGFVFAAIPPLFAMYSSSHQKHKYIRYTYDKYIFTTGRENINRVIEITSGENCGTLSTCSETAKPHQVALRIAGRVPPRAYTIDLKYDPNRSDS